MKKLLILAAGVMLAGCLALDANAGPFGLEMGKAVNELDAAEPIVEGQVLKLSSVPKPHPLFTHYFVLGTERTGLCAISAGSDMFKNDRYASGAKSEFAKIEAQLQDIYGKPQEFKFLKSGALWDEDNDFAMSLYKEERRYLSAWGDNGEDIKDGVEAIELSLVGISNDNVMIKLKYFMKNYDECNDIINSKSKDSL